MTVTSIISLCTASIVFGVVLHLLLTRLYGRVARQAHPSVFRPKPLLTGNEKEFFGRLKRALPEHQVFPQVAMGALVDVSLPESHPQFWPLRRLFQSKICDYVVATRSGKAICVIELDDRTHDNKKDKDQARDALLKNAGITTLRYDSRSKPAEATIHADVRRVLERLVSR